MTTKQMTVVVILWNLGFSDIKNQASHYFSDIVRDTRAVESVKLDYEKLPGLKN